MSFLIDDLVENDPTYKKKATQILKDLQKTGGLEILNNPPEELYKLFGDAYFNVRSKEGCGLVSQGGCSALFKKNLDQAIQEGKNIIFETTGQSFPNWLIEKTGGRYNIVLAYSLVDLCKLFDRNKDRAYKSAIQFLKNPKETPAPRLPNVSPRGPYRDTVVTAKNVLFESIKNACLSQGEDFNQELCSPYGIDSILLFNNNSYPMEFITELTPNKPVDLKALEKIFEAYMNTPITCPKEEIPIPKAMRKFQEVAP